MLSLLVGGVSFLLLATPWLGGQALIVRSGSMVPSINVGDVVLIKPNEVARYAPGDVITFTMPLRQGKPDIVVTHRIIEVREASGVVEYKTQGDANKEADNFWIPEGNVMGKETMTIPYVGKLLAFAKTKVGWLTLIVLPAMAVILNEVWVIWRELKRKKNRLEEVVTAAVLLPLFAGVSLMTPGTYALFTDTAVSSGNTFEAALSFEGALVPGSVVINEVMWMGDSFSSSNEWVELHNTTGQDIDITGAVLVNAGTGAGGDITLSGTIEANGYFLLSDKISAGTFVSNSIVADQVDSFMSMTNTGEQLTLKSPDDVTIDATPVTDGDWAAGETGADRRSMQRIDPGLDGTSDASWQACEDEACNDTVYWSGEGNSHGTPRNPNIL